MLRSVKEVKMNELLLFYSLIGGGTWVGVSVAEIEHLGDDRLRAGFVGFVAGLFWPVYWAIGIAYKLSK